ncbi:hypothetical protein EXU57_15195 [Segetibacter sp. 3557_3]|nr:hypothetical protein EXU57_15195 [Segetibacter sp. 3557_3]
MQIIFYVSTTYEYRSRSCHRTEEASERIRGWTSIRCSLCNT